VQNTSQEWRTYLCAEFSLYKRLFLSIFIKVVISFPLTSVTLAVTVANGPLVLQFAHWKYNFNLLFTAHDDQFKKEYRNFSPHERKN
jgi:hypothetical protein